MKPRASLLLGTGFAAPVAALWSGLALAQPVTGLYVAGAGAANLLQDEEVRISPSFPGGKLRWDAGYGGIGSIGYGFGDGVRVEVEGDFRDNSLQHFLETPYPTAAGGSQKNYGGMVNALFDMDVGQNWIYPYLGIGVGYSRTEWGLHDAETGGLPFSERLYGTDGAFAYQAMFGLGLPVPFVVGLSVTAEYRFFSVLAPGGFHGLSVGERDSYGAGPYGVRSGNVDINSDYNHSFLLGLRYEFNPAPPPRREAPAPLESAPAPAPARSYLVFFDWDRSALTPRARQIVSEAAQNASRVQTTVIEVSGYADTSHALPGARGAAYNQALSLRRADSVRTELVRDGVAPSIIEVHGFGDTRLLVQTGPDAREPQNRRVEIVLR